MFEVLFEIMQTLIILICAGVALACHKSVGGFKKYMDKESFVADFVKRVSKLQIGWKPTEGKDNES